MRKNAWGARIVLAFIALTLLGEFCARYLLGLGTPPLTVSHVTIEYMLKPNQDVYRFGNHFMVNQYGMRSEQFQLQKRVGEFRVLVFGDSVVNGGVLTDQDDLATSLLKRDLFNQDSEKKVVIGNVAAGSWGPGNWLAYAREYGFFDADVVVLLLSSHDYTDNPTFEPLNPNTHPMSPPISALLEGINKYIPKYFSIGRNENLIGSDRFAINTGELAVNKGLTELSEFLSLAQKNVPDLVVLQHLERVEIAERTVHPGHILIQAICSQLGIRSISLESFFRRSIENGVDPYRDNIHLNKLGQRLIADVISDYVRRK